MSEKEYVRVSNLTLVRMIKHCLRELHMSEHGRVTSKEVAEVLDKVDVWRYRLEQWQPRGMPPREAWNKKEDTDESTAQSG